MRIAQLRAVLRKKILKLCENLIVYSTFYGLKNF